MSRRPTLSQRVVARGLDLVLRAAFGDSRLEVQREFLATLGVRGAVRLASRVASLVKDATLRWGEVDTQLLVGLSAMWNGCCFCGYGHALAGSLMQFRDDGSLHPLHPHALTELYELRDLEVLDRLEALLSDDRYAPLRANAARMYALKAERCEPGDEDDRLLLAIVHVWTWYNECSTYVSLEYQPGDAIVPGHSIGRDRPLRARYEQARARERAAGTIRSP